MLFMTRVKLAKPEGMANKEFYEVWLQEAEATVAAMKAGMLKGVYKVPGRYEVIVLLEVDSADTIDHLVHSMPLWKLGYSHLVTDLEWTALRPYENWAEDLKALAAEG